MSSQTQVTPTNEPHPQASKAENLTWELSIGSYKGHATLFLADPPLYRDRYATDPTPGPLSSLTPFETCAHRYKDTAIYILPHYGADDGLALHDEIWRVWYPCRPASCQGTETWHSGSAGFAVPIRCHDVETADLHDGEKFTRTLKLLLQCHLKLVEMVRVNQGEEPPSGKKKRTGWYLGDPGRSLQGTFIIVLGRDFGETNGVVLAVREDLQQELGVEEGKSIAVIQEGVEWGFWSMSLEAAIKKVLSSRGREENAEAMLSDQYVKRFGKDGDSVLVSSQRTQGIVG